MFHQYPIVLYLFKKIPIRKKKIFHNKLLSTTKKFGLRVLEFNSPIPPSRKPVTVSFN